ncbi:unnamed protein product, partial [Prorocentrum cordatum]
HVVLGGPRTPHWLCPCGFIGNWASRLQCGERDNKCSSKTQWNTLTTGSVGTTSCVSHGAHTLGSQGLFKQQAQEAEDLGNTFSDFKREAAAAQQAAFIEPKTE